MSPKIMNPSSDNLVPTVFERALDFVRPGQWLGLGSGKASSAFVRALGAKVRAGLKVVGLPTSVETETLARAEGIPLVTLEEAVSHGLDLHIDGADEFSAKNNLWEHILNYYGYEKAKELSPNTFILNTKFSSSI